MIRFQRLVPATVDSFVRKPWHHRKFRSTTDASRHENIADFKFDVPKRFNFSRDVIDKWAETTNDNRPALWYVGADGSEKKWSYGNLSDESRRIASGLDALGLSGKSIIVILPRIPEWWFLNNAVARMGSVLLVGTTQLTTKDIAYRIKASEAECIITDSNTAEKVDAALLGLKISNNKKQRILVGSPTSSRENWLQYDDIRSSGTKNHTCADTNGDDIMQIFFTSGTTGNPKMVPHTHVSYGIGFQTVGKYWLELRPDDVHWNIADTGWAKSAYSSVFGPWIQGCTVFAHGMPRFEARPVLDALVKYPVTTFCAPPTLYRSMVQEDAAKLKGSSLRHCVAAGEPLNEEVSVLWKKETGTTIKEGYGQTETTIVVGTLTGMEAKPGSMGKPAPGYDVHILDDDMNAVGPHVEGNIAIKIKPDRPVGLFQGYLNVDRQPDCFKGDYYLMGDRAFYDDDGYFWFVGRSDDIIISSGYRIGPFEVESALIEHPAVAESAVVSSPNPERGEIVKAFVILSDPYKQHSDKAKLIKEIQDHTKRITAPYKYPREIEFVESLPKTISGKIKRKELRQQEWEKFQL